MDKDLKYFEIIKGQIKEVQEKREKDLGNSNYWDWILSQLIADLAEFEEKGDWAREPRRRSIQKI